MELGIDPWFHLESEQLLSLSYKLEHIYRWDTHVFTVTSEWGYYVIPLVCLARYCVFRPDAQGLLNNQATIVAMAAR